MSQYFDNKDLFLNPKTRQYGSHMVMTNVHKETKTKYVNIDTRFRDDYSYSQLANYTITLPERITEVKSVYITNVEVPDVLFNVSAVQHNNSLVLIKSGTNTKYTVTVPDNRYTTISSLHTALNTQLHSVTGDNNISISVNTSNKSQIISTTNSYTVNFAVDSSGNFDKSLLNSKLGWETIGARRCHI
jgi:7-cyano-7-deazaguanine synthase in queuosine biosynthesis